MFSVVFGCSEFPAVSDVFGRFCAPIFWAASRFFFVCFRAFRGFCGWLLSSHYRLFSGVDRIPVVFVCFPCFPSFLNAFHPCIEAWANELATHGPNELLKVQDPITQSEVDASIAQRMKEYWGKALAQIKSLHPVNDRELIIKKGKAPLEHLFDEHQYCGDWCYKKKVIEEGKNYVPPDNRPFLSKVTHQRTYQQTKDAPSY